MKLKGKILELSNQVFEQVNGFRRWLHQHPETAFQEVKTSQYICDFLDINDIVYKKGIAKTGIVALIKGNLPCNQVVALRADMDALEIEEKNEIPYKSLHSNMMHACGHDVHMASLMGSILMINQLRDNFGGTFKFIFQPSEEKNPGGASVMIKEGVLKNPDVNSIFAQHVYPELTAGKVGFRAGKYMASTDEIYINVKSKGGHGGLPHRLVDTVLIASHIVVALQQIVSRNADPLVPTVLSFGKFIADGQTNVIPGVVKLAGTLRTFDEQWRKEIHHKIEKLSVGIANSMGADCEVNISKGFPVVFNNEELTNRFKNLAADLLGPENVIDLDLRMTGEDFGFFTQEIPACFYRLGTAGSDGKYSHNLHTPYFDIDNKSLKTATALMTWLAINEINR